MSRGPILLLSWSREAQARETMQARGRDGRPATQKRNARICMAWHEIEYGMVRCGMAGRQAGREIEQFDAIGEETMTAGQRTGALVKLSDRRAEWGGKSKTRPAIKCATHYHRKAIRTRADHAGGDRTGASPGSPVGEGHTPGPDCLLSRRAPKWRESRVVDRCATNKSGVHRRLT